MCILPSFHDQAPDIAIYVPKTRNSWHVQSRSDLFSHPSIIAVDIITEHDTFLVVNVYNSSDCSALGPIIHADFPFPKVIIAGDFNLHHPLWSKPSHATKISNESELLVDSLSLKGFLPLNSPGIETFIRKDYTSVLDLVWISTPVAPHISDFMVNFPMFAGADHFPLTWSLSFHPLNDNPSNFLFHKDKCGEWCDAFTTELDLKWKEANLPDYIPDSDSFLIAVDIFMDAMTKASLDTCLRKPRSPRSAKWFDNDVKRALKVMRNDRQHSRLHPSHHNLLCYQHSNTAYRYQIKKSKRSHAMSYAASVKTSTDMWKLNSWYRGVRKSVTPSLRRPDLTWATSSQEKAELLAHTWFPPPAIITGDFAIPQGFSNPNSRPFIPISEKEITDALSGTSNTSAPGLSGLNYQVLKWAHSSRPDEFGAIIRASVKFGIHHPR